MHELIKKSEERINKSIEVMKGEFAAIRAGRANPVLLDKIKVDYYGTPTQINQMAAVSVSEARILSIQPFDPSTISSIEKAIHASDLGIAPNNDGRVIRIVFPPLTEERRKDIVKQIHKLKEDTKVAIRNIRRDVIEHLKALKKKSELTEDALNDSEQDMQKITDKFIKIIDDLSVAKEKEIMEI
ncbi:MAG: ribosome recycling factor [Oscillospiraceae bacterium]|nr:ribosome recycling factor [Oscillospiraceae bacterium]